ncbi:MAG TPA: DICT sensory domain-containing protein [Nostocaceae cyanobacterium]|nr:DICT sensory domain-containing protein [Nostocaceae cyanobacterium]
MLAGSVLQQLETTHRHSSRPIRFGVYYKNTLVSLCHALEDHILAKPSQPLVITAFQQGKWYLQEADRYADIAKSSREVVIMAAADSGFAEHPTSQLANVNIVALETTDPVAQEWHLIILSPEYTAMVICQELSEADYGSAGLPKSDLERKFYGLWTFEPELVRETAALAIAHIHQYNPQLADKLSIIKESIKPAIASPQDIGAVVTSVINYLQIGQSTVLRQKELDSNLVSNEIQALLRMGQVLDLADINNPLASAEVVAIAETIAQLLDLPAWQIKRLRLASLLHRLDPLQTTEPILTPTTETAPSCPLVPGAQVLRTMPQLGAVAQIINHQSEWWNGTGKPARLAGEDIPLESRILALAAEFQARINQQKTSGKTRQEILTQALAQCQQQQATRFDPKLVDTLNLLVMGLHQGLELPLITPKISSSMWLLDSRLHTTHNPKKDEIKSL